MAHGSHGAAPRGSDARALVAQGGRPLGVTSEPAHAPLGFSTGAVFVEVGVDPRQGRVRVRRIVGCTTPARGPGLEQVLGPSG